MPGTKAVRLLLQCSDPASSAGAATFGTGYWGEDAEERISLSSLSKHSAVAQFLFGNIRASSITKQFAGKFYLRFQTTTKKFPSGQCPKEMAILVN